LERVTHFQEFGATLLVELGGAVNQLSPRGTWQ